jgi:hypothetical protein
MRLRLLLVLSIVLAFGVAVPAALAGEGSPHESEEAVHEGPLAWPSAARTDYIDAGCARRARRRLKGLSGPGHIRFLGGPFWRFGAGTPLA